MINPVARYLEFVDGGLLAVFDASVDGRLLSCNEAFARLIGFQSAREAVGCDIAGRFATAEGAGFLERIGRERQVHNVHGELHSAAGEVCHVMLTGIGDFAPDGGLAGVHGYLIDITERIRAEQTLRGREREFEERLAHAQKMETIGRLAGGVAHDFNNLLTAILGYAELLIGSTTLAAAERHDVEEIQRAGQRAASLTQQLLAFSRRQVLVPKNVDLNVAVTNLRKMLTRLIREDITLACDVPELPSRVRIDPVQLEQVMLNLVLNARDAMPSGGHIRISVGRVPASEVPRPDDDAPADAPEYVSLQISDDGVGLSDEARAHLFEPFFTTKDVGKGTGLGLASVYGIVRQSNGAIHVDSAPGRGSAFTMYFPAAADAVVDDERHLDISNAEPSTETVLLVEDEDAVRAIISAVLRRRGYTVIEAAQPADASALFDRFADEIDLLLTDVVMPDMNGPSLAQRLVARRPDLRVLFISGYADVVRPSDIANPNVGFLGKPFEASALAARVRELLGRRPQAHTRTAGAA